MKRKQLIETIAYICYTATTHTQDWEDYTERDWEQLFQCTSFTVACFLSQHTKLGIEGVESDIILDHLCERPVKDLDEWIKIATNYVDYFNTETDMDLVEFFKIKC